MHTLAYGRLNVVEILDGVRTLEPFDVLHGKGAHSGQVRPGRAAGNLCLAFTLRKKSHWLLIVWTIGFFSRLTKTHFKVINTN